MPHRNQMHGGHHPIKLALSHAQVLKARAGHQIQVAHHQIGHGHTFHLHPETHKKIHMAHRTSKGTRIHITHHELAGSGFLDILKKVASPVLSGLQGVAKELFPSHANTIDAVREGIRGATGYGLRQAKQQHQGHAMKSSHKGYAGFGGAISHHVVGQPSDYQEEAGWERAMPKHKKKAAKKKAKKGSFGGGIMPAGYGY